MSLSNDLKRYGQTVIIREKRAFHYQDDQCRAAFYLLEGKVLPIKFTSSGKRFELPAIEPGRWIALAELYCGGTCLFDALAVDECCALSFTKKNLELAARNPETALEIIRALGEEIILAHRIIAGENAEGKVLSFLLSRKGGTVSGIERSCIRITQSGIAEALALTRETVNRHLKELEAQELITVSRGEIAVPDWQRLTEFMEQRNG